MKPIKVSKNKHYKNKDNGRVYALEQMPTYAFLVTVDEGKRDRYPLESLKEFPEDWEVVDLK
jgi:hypothetical protein